ncbi:MAG: hypothetical protein BMS9Abin26_0283 [Gammaproteobacteria bacterium]|nr:MAG: hypothetical protein BMS9Abin26_0283 [Gammaproteobacteria bacterium]
MSPMDHGSLNWVKGEIDETLKQARLALEAFVGNTDDQTQMQFCVAHLHQVHGTLKLVELYGAALAAEEMEKLAIALFEKTIPHKEETFEVLMRAILQLPDYLERLQAGQKDIPVVLLPLLNDLRASRGKKLLSEGAMFSPDLSVAPSAVVPEQDDVDISVLARKKRHPYQISLLGWFRGKDEDRHLGILADIIDNLRMHTTNESVAQLFWVTTGVINALIQKGIEASVSVKLLLGQVDRKIKALIDAGEDGAEDGAEDLIKNLLYYTASSNTDDGIVGEIKDAFNLRNMLPTENELSKARQSLTGINLEVMDTVHSALAEDITWVKDVLDIYVRSDNREVKELEPIAEALKKVADTLAMLGMGVQRNRIQEQAEVINRILGGEARATDTVLMDIAGTLLAVESSLSDSRARLPEDELAEVVKEEAAHRLPDADLKDVLSATIREAKVDMARVKEAIVAFVTAPWEFKLLKEVPRLNHSIEGSLTILTLPRVAKMLHTCNEYIQTELLDKEDIPNPETLNALADTISSIEYYLEAVDEGGVTDLDAVLDIAAQSLAKLGYTIADEPLAAPEVTLETGPAIGTADETAVVEKLTLPEEPARAPLTERPPEPDTAAKEAAASLVPARISAPADEIDDDIKEIFLEEVDEEMATIAEYLPKWRVNPDDKDALSTVRRSFHTLKGSGRMVGAIVIGEFAWAFENMMNRVIDGTTSHNPEMFDSMTAALKAIPELVEHFKHGTIPHTNVQALANKAYELTGKTEFIELDFGAAPPASDTGTAVEPLVPMPAAEEPAVEEPVVEEPAAAPEPEQPSSELPLPEEDISSLYEEPAPVIQEPGITDGEIDPVLLEIFSKESIGHIKSINDYLANAREVDEPQVTDDLLRALHTLHGSAHMADIMDIADISNALERYAKLLLDNGVGVPGEAISFIEQSVGIITDVIPRLNSGDTQMHHKQMLIDEINKLHDDLEMELEQQEEATTADTPPPAAGLAAHTEAGASEDYDDELLEIFLEEGDEILDASEITLQNWINDQDNDGLVQQLQRELHTLKGGARMANIVAIGDLSHALESMIIAVVEGRVMVSRHMFDLMQQSHDTLVKMLNQVRRNEAVTPAGVLIRQANRLVEMKGEVEALDEAPAEEAAEEVTEKVPATEEVVEVEAEAPAAEVEEFVELVEAEAEAEEVSRIERRHGSRIQHEQIRVKADMLDGLVNFAGEVSIYRSRIEQEVGVFKFNLTEMDATINRLREQLRQFEIETETQIMYRMEKENEDSQYDEDFDPLEMDRFSYMQQLSRSLMETVADLVSIQGLLEGHARETETLLLQQARVNTGLQEGLMSTRMVPLSTQLPRMRRVVRQTCSELKKEVEFDISGEHGEIDRTVLERMMPALDHMLRNAIDHGIESPAQRKKADKSVQGAVNLALSREGSEVVMQLSDDGAGIDLAKLRKKAMQRGLIKKDSDLTDNEVMQFILESGFSTADQITQISGRGVGMDVVSSEIKQLGGSLHIDSEQGQGTLFTIRLPLTLSVNRALLVQVGEENLAIPLSSVEHVVRADSDELKKFHSSPGARYEYAGNVYRFMHLGSILGVSAPQIPQPGKKLPLLLVRAGDHRVALQVDGLMGSREIVVKPVGPQISTVHGISGATILGDGSVALILDISAVVIMDVAKHGSVLEEEAKIEKAGVITVMVVDDSITVRRVTTRLLERNNIRCITAKDGVDAVAELQEHIPDLFLLDIEMPRMDGYELATHIRNNDNTKDIPIIMITSRTGEKHRQRAEAIGVNAYLGKPYVESELLENIQSLLKKPH